MTVVGAGGVIILTIKRTERFKKDYRKLSADLQHKTTQKLAGLLKNPRPPGLTFEKLKGYTRPDIYTIHVTGNYKVSFLVDGTTAILRRVADHNEIDRAP
jgi:mRNA-degrading endonuclease RelE of RelBE toxin-antitoxin system